MTAMAGERDRRFPCGGAGLMRLLAVLGAALAAGCGPDKPTTSKADAGPAVTQDAGESDGGLPADAGGTTEDGGGTVEDGGQPPIDGGGTPADGGGTVEDGGGTVEDGGQPPIDGGGTPEDGGGTVEDGGQPPIDGGGTVEDGGGTTVTDGGTAATDGGPGIPDGGPAMTATKVASGTGYRRVWASALADANIAARALDASTGKAALDLLRTGSPTFQLASGASVNSVRASGGSAPAVLFVNNPNADGVGALTVAPLDGTAPVAVSQGSGVPAGGAFFGASGAQLLFVGSYDVTTDRGVLSWSNGTVTQTVGSSASAYSIVIDSARDRAVGAVNLDANGVGALVGIALSTGATTTLAAAARTLADYKRPGFALSGDGSTLVYTDTNGALQKVSTAGGTPVQLAPTGKLPVVSASGSVVSFFTGTTVAVWSGGQTRDVATAAGTVAPLLSADASRVAWAVNAGMKGGGIIGDVSSAPVAGGAAQSIGANVAWDSVLFSPRGGRLAALTDLRDSTLTANYDQGLGRLFYGLYSGPLSMQSTRVPAGNFGRFDAVDEMVCVGDVQPGSGDAKIVVSNLAAGAPVTIKDGVLKGSLRVATGTDRALFIADKRTDLVVDDLYKLGTLYSTGPVGPPYSLKTNVIDAQFTADGHAIAVVADGVDSGVWVLSVP